MYEQIERLNNLLCKWGRGGLRGSYYDYLYKCMRIVHSDCFFYSDVSFIITIKSNRIRNKSGMNYSKVSFYNDTTVKPEILPFAFPDEVSSGTPLQISCLVTVGDEPITLQWFKDNQLMHSDHETIISHLTPKVSSILLPSVASHSAGLYTCRASNMVGSTQVSSQLKVQGGVFL